MTKSTIQFDTAFKHLTGHQPFPWQESLYARFAAGGDDVPSCCDIPTGLGKTSVIANWLIALANHPEKMPRRLVYVVNRRTVVDQTTNEVEILRRNLFEKPKLKELRSCLVSLELSTLRGQFADNQQWSADPSKPAVICGTVDMIGSRLLFSGYRIGFKSKPLHAGFLGQDAFLIHDEAHLEPAFQELIEAIEDQQRVAEQTADGTWPKLRVMALSATARNSSDESAAGSEVFRLTDEELNVPKHIPDPPTKPIHYVWRRLKAGKTIKLHTIATKDEKNKDRTVGEINKHRLEKILEQVESHQNSGQAILVFSQTVDNVESIVKKLPKDATEQLTGTLRGLERDNLVESPVFQRFLPPSNRDTNSKPAEGTVYLVCTSAGEVGVNISADHLVCDLSTFDSMAQRFGRVNRFGDCDDTRIDIAHPASFGKTDKKGKETVNEYDKRRKKTLILLNDLKGDGSPHALSQLDAEARCAAFAPEPTILPATDILFDAWSLTTIRDKMPGRPPVEPYLHGVTEWDPPQTQVAWREEVGVITGDLNGRYKPQDLLEAYPLKPHELLRDRSDRVLDRLRDLVKEPSSKLKPEQRKQAMDRVVKNRKAIVWLVGERNEVEPIILGDILKQDNKRAQAKIKNRTVLLPPFIGGLNGGFFDGASPDANDVAEEWNDEFKKQRRVRVWGDDEEFGEKTKGMRQVFRINLPGPENDEDIQGRSWHWFVRPRSVDHAGSSTAGQSITWKHHTDDVITRATEIVKRLKLPEKLQQSVILAAQFHDLGKNRDLWQRSIGHHLPGNPKPEDWLAKSGSNTKRPGFRIDYRHEFGSLLDVLDPKQSHLAEFERLGDDMQQLVLHLIAAHHGYGRPHFPSKRVIDPEQPQSQADEQALETPRRFARLQRKYGRWGLAYLESLLRAADWAASAEPSQKQENA